MEDILDVYTLPPDEDIPLVCMDEQPVQLLEDRYEAVKMKPGVLKKRIFNTYEMEPVRFLCLLLRIWVDDMWMQGNIVQRLIGHIRLIIW
jgi:hypothetical protein